MNTYVMIIRTRPLKERVNISVDTAVHQRFSQFAERNSQTVSGILNDLMAIYTGPDEDDADPFTGRRHVVQRLRSLLTVAQSNSLQGVVEGITRAAGLTPARDPADGPPQGDEYVTEWIGDFGRRKTGVRLTFNLGHEPDIALGQSLLFRGAWQSERVILVVPCRLSVSEKVLHATEQAGMEVVGVDGLEALLGQRTRRDQVATEDTPSAARKHSGAETSRSSVRPAKKPAKSSRRRA